MATILRPTSDDSDTIFAHNRNILIVVSPMDHSDGGRHWVARVTDTRTGATDAMHGTTAALAVAACNGRYGTAFTSPAAVPYCPAADAVAYALTTTIADLVSGRRVYRGVCGHYATTADACDALEDTARAASAAADYRRPNAHALSYRVGTVTVRVTVTPIY